MKTRLIFLLPLLFFLISCGDSDSETAKLELSQSTFDDVSAPKRETCLKMRSPEAKA